MLTSPLLSRRRLLRATALLVSAVLVGLLLGWLLRYRLTAFAVRSSLMRAGAGDIRFAVTEVSPWAVKLNDLDFKIDSQDYEAAQLTVERAHWWQSNLGDVRVAGLQVPLVIDGSDLNPRQWPSYSGSSPSPGAPAFPADALSVDGVIHLKAAALADREVVVHFEGRRIEATGWSGRAHLQAPDLELAVEGRGDFATGKSEFHTTALELGLGTWQEFVQRLEVIPGGPWQLAGKVNGSLNGIWENRKLSLSGAVHLAGVDVRNDNRNVTVLGAEADFDVLDFVKFRTKPGVIRVRELHAGDFSATDLSFNLAFAGLNTLQVAQAKLSTLGGSLSAEPFTYQLNKNELDATVVAEGLDMEKILSLSQTLSGAAIGRVGGRLPLRIDSAGVRFGTGWLSLAAGVHAEVTLRSAGLLTTGVATSSPTYTVLKKVETGITRLKVSEMRLDIRPPDAPPGRTAQLHLVGEPMDPNLKAPITLDLNVNGPVEQLINLSLDHRVHIGGDK